MSEDNPVAAYVRRLRAKKPSTKRYVVTGPPNAGKSTWCRQRAKDGDLVWDFDVLASAFTLAGRQQPRNRDGNRPKWPWPTMQAMLVMRQALLEWLHATELLSGTQVFVIVRDREKAAQIAIHIKAKLIEWSREQWDVSVHKTGQKAEIPLNRNQRCHRYGANI